MESVLLKWILLFFVLITLCSPQTVVSECMNGIPFRWNLVSGGLSRVRSSSWKAIIPEEQARYGQEETSLGANTVVNSEKSICWTGDPLLWWGLVRVVWRGVCLIDGHGKHYLVDGQMWPFPAGKHIISKPVLKQHCILIARQRREKNLYSNHMS